MILTRGLGWDVAAYRTWVTQAILRELFEVQKLYVEAELEHDDAGLPSGNRHRRVQQNQS